MTTIEGRGTLDPALAERLSKMSPAKRALFLKAAGLPAELAQQILVERGAGIPRRDPSAPVPMSFAQELLWRLERTSPGHAYNVPRATRLRGELDVAALERALDALVARHEILRTTFDLVNGEARQIVHAPGPVALEVVDLITLPANTREDEARRVVRGRSQRPFDLAVDRQLRATLVRIGPDDHVLLLESHHVASDVISRGITYRELVALYREARGGSPASLAPLERQYADFAAWQRADLRGPRLEQLLSYWRDRLAGARAIELPTDTRGGTASDEGGGVVREVPVALRDGLRRLNAAHGTTLFMAVLAAIDVLLSRYTQQTDIVIGSPISGRPHADVDGVVGYFVNTLVLRTSLEGNPTFANLLERVRATSLGAFEHQDVPYELLLTELSGVGRAGSAPLFNVMLSALDGESVPLALDGTTASAFASSRGAAKFDLLFAFREHDRGIRLGIEYRRDLFAPETAARMLEHLETLLTAAVAAPETPVETLPLLTDAERHQVLVEWNDTDAAWPTAATLHSLFETQAARRPNAIAVQCDGASLTYSELDRRANRLAWRLRARGVVPDTLVGVCLEKSVDTVATLLGILKAGGAYLPLDPSYPDDRLAFILEDSGAKLVVTEADLVERLTGGIRSRIPGRELDVIVGAEQWSDGADARDDAPPPSASPSSLCYVIYTSGSTGRPKGALIEHRNVVRLLFNDRFQFQFSERDVWTVFHSFSFDFSVWEMYGALLYGGRLVVVPRRVAQDPRAFLTLLAAEGVTVLNQVPSAFYGLMREELSQPTPSLSVLRYVIFGGEALQPALLREWKERYPSTTLINMFGITETTVHVTFKEIGVSEIENGASNIGGPIPTLTLYVLDDHLQPVPVGVTGELCVGGAGVARGYLARPELTAERFVQNPFRPGERLYRSGDLGRRRSTGEIEYLGRRDAQVKIRGFRIELGEIESALAAHPAVRQTAVIATDSGQLAGYYVPASQPGEPTATTLPVTPAALRSYLHERLPDYMVPAFLVPLDAIPATANGKLDRAALPSPQSVAGETKPAFAIPRTVHEHQLAEIWKGLLGLDSVGIRDDFFELGGHSLLAVRMLAEVEAMSGRRVPLAALFEDSTIERLACRLELEVASEEEPPVVILPSNPDARPFVFLHGDVRGGGWYSRHLSRMLGPTVKFIVLPTIRPGGKDPVTIEAMAALQISRMRAAQPTGPYRLGGLCLGATIAFEMAQQLFAAGEEVEQLIVINSGLHNRPYPRSRWLLNKLLPTADDPDVLEHRSLWLGRIKRARHMSLSQRWKSARRIAARLLAGRDRETEADVLRARHAQGEIYRRLGSDVQMAWKRAAGSYLPRPFAGSIDLIVSAEPDAAVDFAAIESMGAVPRPHPTRVSRRGWEHVADVRLYPITTTFIGLITSELNELAAQLRTCLRIDAAGTPDTTA
jgi:amino acid adenylation domain-containing protein